MGLGKLDRICVNCSELIVPAFSIPKRLTMSEFESIL